MSDYITPPDFKQLNVHLMPVILPYTEDNSYSAILRINGWVAVAHCPNGIRWIGRVYFVRQDDVTNNDYWETRRSYKSQTIALRAAARCMLVLIAYKRQNSK